ncbi:hypothetical protein [uncultured Enterovirga sp.]|uniref:hypothetical protein n=1 Tax=uncultured Enterovirga sp. TaxID=2026352 RepID=UPI0035CB1F0D
MVGFVSTVFLLVYLGRVLAWTWGTKPFEAGDVVFLLPLVVIAVLVRRRAVRPRLRQPPAAAAEIDAADEPSEFALLEGPSKARIDESENLRRQQEWAAADYHWWKR